MSFNTKLTELLKTDKHLVDGEGELIIAAVQDRAWKIDRDLVKLLLSDNEFKAAFFEEIEGHWIFNHNTFIDYISQKNFLDNSYTRFRNRIGLTIGGKYLRERGDVALVWPYKVSTISGIEKDSTGWFYTRGRDAQFQVTQEDKELNRKFYGGDV